MSAEFECAWCEQVIRFAHEPPAAPKCPSCGCSTHAKTGNHGFAFCASCHGQFALYSSRKCPNCNIALSGFTGKIPSNYSKAVRNSATLVKQGPSGGVPPLSRYKKVRIHRRSSSS